MANISKDERLARKERHKHLKTVAKFNKKLFAHIAKCDECTERMRKIDAHVSV